MNAKQLADELQRRGLVILDVTTRVEDPHVAVIYLHGNLGQWIDGYALRVVKSIPGIRNAASHVRTEAIMVAWMEP